jgi:hypothetical protein
MVMVHTVRNFAWAVVQLRFTSGTVLAAVDLGEGRDYLNQQVESGL